VNTVTGVYVIGSPLVNWASIHTPANGERFGIIVEIDLPEDVFIKNAELNWRELARS